MAFLEYNKPIRDRFSESIRRDGHECGAEILPKEAYHQACSKNSKRKPRRPLKGGQGP